MGAGVAFAVGAGNDAPKPPPMRMLLDPSIPPAVMPPIEPGRCSGGMPPPPNGRCSGSWLLPPPPVLLARLALIRSRSLWQVWHCLFWHERTCCSSIRFTCAGSSCRSFCRTASLLECTPPRRGAPPETLPSDGGGTDMRLGGGAPVAPGWPPDGISATREGGGCSCGGGRGCDDDEVELRVRCSACHSLQTLHSAGWPELAPCARILHVSTCSCIRLSTCLVSTHDFCLHPASLQWKACTSACTGSVDLRFWLTPPMPCCPPCCPRFGLYSGGCATGGSPIFGSSIAEPLTADSARPTCEWERCGGTGPITGFGIGGGGCGNGGGPGWFGSTCPCTVVGCASGCTVPGGSCPCCGMPIGVGRWGGGPLRFISSRFFCSSSICGTIASSACRSASRPATLRSSSCSCCLPSSLERYRFSI
mmetsp:Transcript_40123/g.126850  ORF Transcript_40123/g.126850 Transcript_40123/m.126850 type:complete len:420 (-) Transcript_40123:123-1382(-)